MEVSKINRFMQSKKTADLRKSAETGGYMNADEVETALLNVREAHPDFVTLIELPYKTWNRRLCRAVYIHAKNGSSSNRGGGRWYI